MNNQQPIENILHNAKPKADAVFENNLEEQLIARLHEKYDTNEDNPMMTKMKRKHSAPRSRLPFTLATAIIAIVLVGGLVILLNRSSLSLQPTVLFTPTPAPMSPDDETGIPVMVAARDIGVGEIVTAAMVHRVYWSRDVAGTAIEANPSYGGLFGNWEDVIGQQAQTFIPQWHPIQADMIDSPVINTLLDEGMVFIATSINQSQVYTNSSVHTGDIYDIAVSCLTSSDSNRSLEIGSIVDMASDCNFIINNAQVIFMGNIENAPDYIPRSTVTSPTDIGLAIIVREADAQRISRALNSTARLSLQSSDTIR